MAGNQKAIKLRIKSVQSTMQICKAMELVAASRLHKAMERAENSRPYFEALQGTLRFEKCSNAFFPIGSTHAS